MRRLLCVLATAFLALCPATDAAAAEGFTFASIDGGEIRLDDWRGRPVLVANTASLCGYTWQYDGLQELYDRYRARGLVVLAVPSDDFRQELGSADEVREFCAINFGLDIPMTDITRVRGREAHPFFLWLAEAHGFVPRWNFNKVLVGPDGDVLATWDSAVPPLAPEIRARIEPLLAR
jgi:glutathione peroxidase